MKHYTLKDLQAIALAHAALLDLDEMPKSVFNQKMPLYAILVDFGLIKDVHNGHPLVTPKSDLPALNRGQLKVLAHQYRIKNIHIMPCDEIVQAIMKAGGDPIVALHCPEHMTLGEGMPCSFLLAAQAHASKSKGEVVMKKDHKSITEELRAAVLASEGKSGVVETKVDIPWVKEEPKTVTEFTDELIARRIHNPAIMAPVEQTGIYKHLAWKKTFVTIDGKRRMVKEFDGLRDYEDIIAPMPVNSPLKQFVDAGDLRYCRIAQLDQDGKFYKRQKFQAFRAFQEVAIGAGYLCIQPDWKDTEIQVFYETPEKLALFFCITVEKLYKSLGKLHKWLKLVKTPTKLKVDSEMELRVLYIDEPNDPLNRPRVDGDIYVNMELHAFKAGGGAIWEGFSQFMQMRSDKSIQILLKGLAIFNQAHFMRKARTLTDKYGFTPKRYDVIINQHAVKFDNVGMVDGTIYTFKACDLFRFVGGRFKQGTSTLGAQLVAMSDMGVASGVLKEHGLMESAMLIKAMAKGMPYAWIHIAHDYRKIDTNKFLELAFCINRPQYGWRMAKMPTLHNRNMGFLENEWRKRISSVQVNTESAYAYTDERCDAASIQWHEKTGEWKSFAIVPKDTELNDRGEVASIKYPLHSKPCIATHTALTEDIFNPESPLVAGLLGGLGLSTMYQRSVKGLDCDGDKLAKFRTAFSIPTEFDFSVALEEEKVVVAPITNLQEAVAKTLELAHGASADTLAIGTIDLTIRYCFMWAHINGVVITPEISSAIGELREGGIKGGVKGDTKGIASSSTHLDIPTSLENGTLSQDIIAWFGVLCGTVPEAMADFGEINKNNLAELAHYLVVKGAGCKERGHGDKFLHRMQVLLPAYMAHTGDKSQNPWHDAMVLMADGIKPEYLTADKNDCLIVQNQYKAVWKLVQQSFAAYGPVGLGYTFDLENVQGFAGWINAYYKNNSLAIQRAFRGHRDPETGDQLVYGDFDADLKTRRYIKLLRVIRFLLNGLEPHEADKAALPHGAIPEVCLERGRWFANNTKETNAFLKFCHIFIATSEFNIKGAEGNSGGMAWNFPASSVYDAREMYYDSTPQGQKEERNPNLGIAKGLAAEFDHMWLKRAQEWIARNPNAKEFIYPEMDEEDFEEEEIAQSVFAADDDYDSVD